MQIRWKIVFLIALLALGVTALVNRKTATAATPQATASAVKAPPAGKNAKDAPSSGISIPDTTLAINSDKPMSERVVHYEIDAKYDADKHIVDATEVLTYHNRDRAGARPLPFPSLSECVSAQGHLRQRLQAHGQPRHFLRDLGRQVLRLGRHQELSKLWAREI